MKLKKVVSVALAGVMAVSMLAGCGTDKPAADDKGESVVTGYSAEFAKYVEDIADLDYVTFQNSADDLSALESIKGYFSDTEIGQLSGGAVLSWSDVAKLDRTGKMAVASDEFIDNAGITASALNYANMFFKDYATTDMDGTLKIGNIYFVDGTMDTSKALKLVANKIDTYMSTNGGAKVALPKDGDNGNIVSNYKYVVSVSVVDRATTNSTVMTDSIKAIAVTITRTGTLAG